MTRAARQRLRLRAAAPFLLLATGLALASCAGPERPRVPDDYRSWAKTTETPLDYPIPGHMDSLRVIRMNAIGFAHRPRVEEGRLRWDFPAGTVIVKEVYASARPGPEEGPKTLTIMAKEPRDPRSRGGWLWLTRSLPDGREDVFAGSFCVTCHENANEPHPYFDKNPSGEFRDYLYFVPQAALDAARTEAGAEGKVAQPDTASEYAEYGASP